MKKIWYDIYRLRRLQGTGSGVQSIVAGTNITVNNADPQNPIVSATGGSISDGNKGDITVSSSGAVWTVNNDAVTNAKLANMAGHTVKARTGGSSGDPEDLAIGSHDVLGRNGGNISSLSAGNNTVLRRNTGNSLEFGKVGTDHFETSVNTSLGLANTSLQPTGTSSQFFKGDGSLDSSTYLTGNQSITLSGAITGSGATSISTTLGTGVVGITNLSATGTPSASTYLRGDNTWGTPGGGGGMVWTEITGTTSGLSADNGYVANNAAQVVFTLPATCAFGKEIAVEGLGAGGWRISQNSGQSIIFGDLISDVGTAGYLESYNRYDGVKLLCIEADTRFKVISSTGNIFIETP